MNARQAASTRKTSCFATTSHHIRPPNATISSRKNVVLCGSKMTLRTSGLHSLLGPVAPRTARVRPMPPGRRDRGGGGIRTQEGLPLHTLSRTAPGHPPPVASVPDRGRGVGSRLPGNGLCVTGYWAGGNPAGLPEVLAPARDGRDVRTSAALERGRLLEPRTDARSASCLSPAYVEAFGA